jgi:RNA polymerase sigma factor (sigma-70 family)
MPRGQLDSVVQYIRQLADDGPSDGQLLERFTRHRDEAAFASLVRRHGPLVAGVCRRLLHCEQDAEDVFQATFLVLARKAASIRKREAVGSWLYGVATRLARQARADAARRQARERQVGDVPVEDPPPAVIWQDLRPVLDEAIEGLPRRYRDPFVLCHLQGKTNEQAARELACPLGTVLSRLARARGLLRLRLARRGITLSSGMLVAVLAEHGSPAAVSGVCVEQTMRAAMVFAAGKGLATGAVSAPAALLAEGVLRAMFILRIRIVGTVLLLLGLIGTGVYSRQVVDEKGEKESGVKEPGPQVDRKDGREFSREKDGRSYADPDKEALRMANKLLEEEIEDEKAKLEALHKKLDRLKNSGIRPPQEDAEWAKLKRENRQLQQKLKNLQDEVRLTEEVVQPYLQTMRRGAGKAAPGPHLDAKMKWSDPDGRLMKK